MKRLIIFGLLLMMIGSCTAPNRFIVTNLGYEPEEMKESVVYALPKNSLKVSLTYEKNVIIPGPYADYALKLLGIENVPKKRSQDYSHFPRHEYYIRKSQLHVWRQTH